MPFFGGNICENVKPGGGKSWLKYMGLETGDPIPSTASKTESADHLKLFHECHPVVNLPAAEGDTPNLYIGLLISAYQW